MLLEHISPGPPELKYHKDIGFPEDLVMPRGFRPVMRLQYGPHSRKEAMAEKYGNLNLPDVIDVRNFTTIEVGVDADGKTVNKLVLRASYDKEKDIIIVVMPATGFVKTVWANLKSDAHSTLKRGNYLDPKTKRPAR